MTVGLSDAANKSLQPLGVLARPTRLIGDGDTTDRMPHQEPGSAGQGLRPLSGLRVLDVATFIAAPLAAGVLGEFGAEVIKVEQPGEGDPLRKFGTPGPAADSLCWLSEARNKKSITLDLRLPEGAALFKQLVRDADIVCESFRPGTLEKWGLGYDTLSAINPRLILLRVSGFGQTGPYRDRPGFARIAHAFAGLAHLTGMPGGPPLTPGSTSLADYMCGLYGALGILIALRAREQTGRGQVVDIALYEAIFRVLDDLAPTYAQDGTIRGRLGLGTGNACPHGHFATKDDRWVALACSSDRMFARLAELMGESDLARPDRFGEVRQRLAHRDEVDARVSAWIKSQDADGVVAACTKAGVPCAPVNSIADIFDDPHVQARENLITIADDAGRSFVVPNTVPRLSETPGWVGGAGPALGSANDEIYGGLLGLSEGERAKLAKNRII